MMPAPVLDAALAQAEFVEVVAPPLVPIAGLPPGADEYGNYYRRTLHGQGTGGCCESGLITSLSDSALYVANLVPHA